MRPRCCPMPRAVHPAPPLMMATVPRDSYYAISLPERISWGGVQEEDSLMAAMDRTMIRMSQPIHGHLANPADGT